MKKFKRELLEFIPFVIICVYIILSVIIMLTRGIIIQWQHYLAFPFLLINGLIFYRGHKKGVLFLGFILILGVFGILAFQVGLVGASLYWMPFDVRIPLFIGNPMLFGIFVLHLILSGRYYVGILTRRYWLELNNTSGASESQFNPGDAGV
jgi:hypothetical protein